MPYRVISMSLRVLAVASSYGKLVEENF